MLYFCPNCNQKSVCWDKRCRHFICLVGNCSISIKWPEITKRNPNDREYSDEEIQDWINEQFA